MFTFSQLTPTSNEPKCADKKVLEWKPPYKDCVNTYWMCMYNLIFILCHFLMWCRFVFVFLYFLTNWVLNNLYLMLYIMLTISIKCNKMTHDSLIGQDLDLLHLLMFKMQSWLSLHICCTHHNAAPLLTWHNTCVWHIQ